MPTRLNRRLIPVVLFLALAGTAVSQATEFSAWFEPFVTSGKRMRQWAATIWGGGSGIRLVSNHRSCSGRVFEIGISDGDTIRVLHDGISKKIRLFEIDCPEMGQPFCARAKELTGDLAFGKTVNVRVRDIDRYHRIVAEITLPDGRMLNQELVRAGLAWWYRRYARSDAELQRLEIEARETKRGLWADPNPVPPWTWRKQKTAPSVGASQ
jgi:micrococcal nuclease